MALHRRAWHGPWAQRAVAEFLAHRRVVWKWPRQTGKTWQSRDIIETFLLAGEGVIVASPTLDQTINLIARPATVGFNRIAPMFGIRQQVHNAKRSEWSNGARLQALSMTPDSQKEGYTGSLLYIDEAHRARRDEYTILSPMLTQAMREERDYVLISSIGGTNEALSEQAYREMGFHLVHVTPEEVLAADADYRRVMERFREEMTNREFAQHIECKNLGEGMHQAYPLIPAQVDIPREAQSVRRRLTFGIDVGWVKDETVVVVLESVPNWSVHNVIAVHTVQGGPFHEQAERVFAVIDEYTWDPGRIGVEWNGGGAGLYYALAQLMPGIQRVTITNKVKFGAVSLVQRALERGHLGIADARARAELASLQIDYKGVDEDRWEITHSDTHSALLVAVAIGGL